MSNYSKGTNFFTHMHLGNFEFSLFCQLIIVVLAARVVGVLAVPLLMCIFPSVMFAVILLFTVLISLLTPDGSKSGLVLPLIRFAMKQCCEIEYSPEFVSRIDSKCLIVMNYPKTFCEYLLVPMMFDELNKGTCILLRQNPAVWGKHFMDSDKLLILGNEGNNFEQTLINVGAASNAGKIVLAYPEDKYWKRSQENEIRPFRSGIFSIAQKLKMKIVVAHLGSVDHSLGFVKNKKLKMQFEFADSFDHLELRDVMIRLSKDNS